MRRSPRPTGVTLSAVLLLAIGALLLLGSGLILDLTLAAHQYLTVSAKHVLVFFAMLFLPAATWAITSGVGLVKVKEWARISAVIMGALLCFISLVLVAVAAVIPLRQEPTLAQADLELVRAVAVGIFALPAAAAAWCVFYLTRKNVTSQFQPLDTSQAMRARPISVAIVAWYLLISAIYGIWFLLVPTPTFLFSILLTGRAAHLMLVLYGILHIIMAVGLLKLQNWARVTTISYFLFFALNNLVSTLLPGNSDRFRAAMGAYRRALGSSPGRAHAPHWIGLLISILLAVAVTWVLVTRKHAFTPTAPRIG